MAWVRHPDGMDDALPQLRPPERLLCGPGPTNVDPAVLEAMTRPMLGHLDPKMHEILLDVVALLRRVYRMPDGLVLPLHCTGTAGMEAGITNLLEPGDTVIVAAVRLLRPPDLRDRAAPRGARRDRDRRLGRVRLERRTDGGARSRASRLGWWRSCTPRPPRAWSIRSPSSAACFATATRC